MQAGKIVLQGKTKNNQDFIIRYPTMDDAKQLLSFINALSLEKTFIMFQGEQQTLEQEQKWLEGQIKKINEHQGVTLLVEIDGQIVGNSTIDLRRQVESHVGLFGITISKGFRNEGIGTDLMKTIIEEATKQLSNMKIIELSVFADNPVAKELYQKMGFKEFGNLPEGVLHDENYVDHIYMYKKVK